MNKANLIGFFVGVLIILAVGIVIFYPVHSGFEPVPNDINGPPGVVNVIPLTLVVVAMLVILWLIPINNDEKEEENDNGFVR